MPRKKNNRKAIQRARIAAQPRPKPRNIGTIAHIGMGGRGVALAILAASVLRQSKEADDGRG